MPDHEIYRLLDLAATEEDQHEVCWPPPLSPSSSSSTDPNALSLPPAHVRTQITNLPRDYTMKPGGQRASLPLMRRFNEHSERLLNQALCVEPALLVRVSLCASELGRAAAPGEREQDAALTLLVVMAPEALLQIASAASSILAMRACVSPSALLPPPRLGPRSSSCCPVSAADFHSSSPPAQDRRYYNEIELSDLSAPTSNGDRIALTLAERSDALGAGAGGASKDGEGDGRKEGEGEGLEEQWKRKERVRRTIEGVRDGWEGRLAEVRLSRLRYRGLIVSTRAPCEPTRGSPGALLRADEFPARTALTPSRSSVGRTRSSKSMPPQYGTVCAT